MVFVPLRRCAGYGTSTSLSKRRLASICTAHCSSRSKRFIDQDHYQLVVPITNLYSTFEECAVPNKFGDCAGDEMQFRPVPAAELYFEGADLHLAA
eukprot:2512133-Amphidinium_carterae.1